MASFKSRLSSKDSYPLRSASVKFRNTDDDQSTNEHQLTVDVKKLDSQASRKLLDAVLETHDATRDHSLILDKVRERLEKANMIPPSVTVTYRNLSVETDTVVTERRVPNLLKSLTFGLVGAKSQTRKTRLTLLEPCSGIIKPGRLVLLLGPPGSGRTTFLRALSGRSHKQPGLRVNGDVLYNGKPFSEFVPARAAAYVSQADLHYGELTVRETFEFSARCQGPGFVRRQLEMLVEREKEMGITPDPAVDAFMKASAWHGHNTVEVELTLRLLGLDTCADTVVGNRMLRGISGGEKKRVTSGEALVGRARVLFGDEVSTGLDSRTTFDVVRYLKGWTRAMNGTVVLALLQPSPETFELFDDVILLSNGVVVYDGTREGILPFFHNLGFECPMRHGVAEFLQEVTTPTDQSKFWSAPGNQEYSYVAAHTMAKALANTEERKNIERELDSIMSSTASTTTTTTDKKSIVNTMMTSSKALAVSSNNTTTTAAATTTDMALPTHMYGASYWVMWKANFKRAWSLQSRRKLFLYVRCFQVALMAVVVATLYIKVGKSRSTIDDGNTLLGAQFFGLIYMLMAGAAELHLLGERLPVFYRQREMHLYPGSAFALPSFLFRLPYCLFDAVLWTLIVYWALGMNSSPRFFMYLFLMFLTAVWATSLYQALAALVDHTVANSVSSFLVMLFVVTGGFVITPSSLPSVWKACYWANPWAYITQSMAINEFSSSSWNVTNPADPSGLPLGLSVLSFRGFQLTYEWVWIGVGAVFLSIFINVGVFVLACTYLHEHARDGFITEDALAELEANRSQKPLPPSLKKEIELGMKRSASMAKLTSTKYNSSDNLHALTDAENGAISTNGTHHHTNTTTITITNGGIINNNNKNNNSIVSSADATITSIHQAALPFEPLILSFKDVEYSVPIPPGVDPATTDKLIPTEGPHAGQLQLLQKISGVLQPGICTALMGASGAGKTTLMDCLAGRKTGGVLTGDIRVNGHPKEQATFSRVSAYCEQEDTHLAEATVAEAVAFSAAMRLPSTVSAETRSLFIEEIISLVELQRLKDVCIGHVGGTGLTIEQRKRLTIAVELVANPSILFLDEPTTALDARGASVVMSVVRNTAATGRTVVCTIHQPSIAIFEAFDELILLKPGGRVIYDGPLGNEGSSIINYFQSIPGISAIKPRLNPANWMLEETAPRKEGDLGVDFADIWAESSQAVVALQKVDAVHEPQPGSKPLSFEDLNVRPLLTQFRFLLHRFFVMYWRLPKYQLIRIVVTVLVGIVFGTLFFKQGQNLSGPATVLNASGVLFMSVLFVGVTNALTVQLIIYEERTVFYREHAAGMYNSIAFALAQGLVELPFLLVQACLYVFPLYFMVDFSTSSGKLGWFFLYFFLTLWYFTEFGGFCVNLTPELPIATLLTSFMFSFMNLFSGFMIAASYMGWWWRWVIYLNPVAWSLYSLVVSQFGDDTDVYITDFTGQVVSVSEFIYERFGYAYGMVGPLVAILFAYVLFYRGMSVLALSKLNFQRR